MFRWITTVNRGPQNEPVQVLTVARPAITAGEGMLRIQGPGEERWLPLPVQSVEVSEAAHDGLLEILEQQDLDLLTERASEFMQSENPDDRLIGSILVCVGRYYKECLASMAPETEASNEKG